MPEASPPTPDHRYDERPSDELDVSSAARPSNDSDDTNPAPPSRRSFLASSAAAVGVASTAGCVELLPPLGQEVRFADVSPPDRGPLSYREWIPSPSVSDSFDLEPGMVATPNADSAASTGTPMNLGETFFGPQLDYFGIGIENYDLALSLGGGQSGVFVLEGPVAPDEVASTVLESGYEAAGSRTGYDRYVRDDIPRSVAVTDGRILFGRGSEPGAAIDAALSTYRDGPTLASTDADFERVTDAAGLPAFGFLGTSFHGPLADYPKRWYASTVDFDEDWFYYCNYYVFQDGRPSEAEARTAFEDVEIGAESDRIDVARDGQFLSLEARQSPNVFDSGAESRPRRPPQITWGVERDGDALLVRHEAGDSVPAANLTVHAGWPDADRDDPAPVQFTDEYESVSAGSELRVPIEGFGETPPSPDTPLVVVYERGNSSATLLQYGP